MTDPFIKWLERHHKIKVYSKKTLQSAFSQSCGDYALMFLVLKVRGANMQHFSSLFSSKDLVNNDCIVGSWLRACVVNQLAWTQLKPADQINPTCVGYKNET